MLNLLSRYTIVIKHFSAALNDVARSLVVSLVALH